MAGGTQLISENRRARHDYNLLERLEASGPGDLFRARDTKLGRTVAVRLLPADFTVDRQRLIAAARGLSALSHPNVTALFDVGEHDSRVYLAFEFQKGQSLRAESAGRPMNVRRAVEIAIQIADAGERAERVEHELSVVRPVVARAYL